MKRPGGTFEIENVPSACVRPVSIGAPIGPLPLLLPSCGISITAAAFVPSPPPTIPLTVAKRHEQDLEVDAPDFLPRGDVDLAGFRRADDAGIVGRRVAGRLGLVGHAERRERRRRGRRARPSAPIPAASCCMPRPIRSASPAVDALTK